MLGPEFRNFVSGHNFCRNFSKCPNPPKTSKSRETTLRLQSKKVAQRERAPDEPKKIRKLAGGTELRPKKFSVGWVPNRQNRSPTDEMAPSPPPNGHIPGPRDTWGPKQGTVGPHLACDQIWPAAVSSRMAPKTGKIHFLVFLARFGP